MEVTPSVTESTRTVDAATAVAVKVTDSLPLVATTWRTAGLAGKVKTVLAIPAAFVRTVLALRDPSPLAIAQLTETPGNGS